MKFSEYVRNQERYLWEMTARRSFKHTMSKLSPEVVKRPVAILTAWRGELKDAEGKSLSKRDRESENELANQILKKNLEIRGLSFYPVVGAGQEVDEFKIRTVNKENSFVVSPVKEMSEEQFIKNIQELLYDPAMERTGNNPGPYRHTQWGAMVKLPSSPQAVIWHHGEKVTGPHDYGPGFVAGTEVSPRTKHDKNYTQMKFGPRASQDMLDNLDKPDDLGNHIRFGDSLPGKRFAIRQRRQA